MSRILIEPAMPFGPKFAGATEIAIALHFKALCHSALMLTDGFIASARPYELVKARRQDVEKAIKHLSTTQPGCDHPSWEERPGGWFLHDYDDPIYANPLRETVRTLQQVRAKAAAAGGRASARVRQEKYGTAQPPRVQASKQTSNDSLEPPFENTSRSDEASVEANLERPSRSPSNLHAMRSTTTDVHGDHKNVSSEHGDTATEVGNGTAKPALTSQAIKLVDWLLVNRGDHTFGSRDEQAREMATATQIMHLGLPFADVMAMLQAYRDTSDSDDVASSLNFYYDRIQLDSHDRLKQPRSHARSNEGLTRVTPTTRGAKP